MDLLLIVLTVLLKLLNLLNDKKELIWFQGKQRKNQKRKEMRYGL